MNNPKMLVAAMTGSAAKVLWAFFFARTALDIAEIQSWTGLKRQTAYQALEQLREYELLEPTTGPHGRQIWHLGSETLLPIIEETLQMSEKRTSAPRITTTADQSLDKNSDPLIVVVGSQMSEKRTSGAEPIIYESHDASLELNLAACQRAGIGEPKRTQISRMPHVTPRLIIDHARSLIPGESMGLAIRRIEGNEVPRSWQDEIPSRDEIERQQSHLDPDDIEEVE